MINKKADILPDNATSIIIAVIILALFTLGTLTACSKINTDEERANAIALIDKIKAKMSALEQGQSNTFNFQGFTGDWHLTGWSKSNLDRPDKCFSQSCICISPEPTSSSCQNEGIKRDVDEKNIIVQMFLAQGRFSADLVSTPENFKNYEEIIKDHIALPENFFQLEITKEENQLTINYHTPTHIEANQNNDIYRP